ncbi:hypothetical protein BAU14_11535 [Enterococcus sp. CU9D]|nr:hypothetical protein BAU14_11535 [Enterococcus sp. CU9D]
MRLCYLELHSEIALENSYQIPGLTPAHFFTLLNKGCSCKVIGCLFLPKTAGETGLIWVFLLK